MTETTPRPSKKTDYCIVLNGPSVEKGWRDCIAQVRNAMVEAWERLTEAPAERSERQYQLAGELAARTLDGKRLPQWQYKISDAGRLRYLVDDAPVVDNRGRRQFAGRVIVVAADPGHPGDTDKRRRR